MEWFRSHHGAPTDPKWLVIAAKAGTRPGVVAAIWWALMDRASQSSPRGSINGFDAEAVAAFYGFPEAEVHAVLAALEAKGLIADGALVKWSERQPRREREDNSAERVRRLRERQRQPRNAVSEDVTPSNATKRPVTPRGEERRVEEIKPPPTPDGVGSPTTPTTPSVEAVTLLGNGGAEALEALKPKGGIRAALASICNGFLYEFDDQSTARDPSVKGLPLPERRELVARALVDMWSNGWGWSAPGLAGNIRKLRYQPPARDAPSNGSRELTKAQLAKYREIRAALEEGGMDPNEAAEEADRRART